MGFFKESENKKNNKGWLAENVERLEIARRNRAVRSIMYTLCLTVKK